MELKDHPPPQAPPQRMKALAHVDLDAFYTQVEAKRNPDIHNKPLVVVQYNPFGDLRDLKPEDNRVFPESNGSIIAVSYEARAHGVKRNMMAQQAKAVCPDLIIVQVPVAHGKADLTIYRNAGAEVMNILSSCAICERASIDEAYLDVTEEAAKRVAKHGAAEAAAAPAAKQGATGAAAAAGDPDLTGWHLAGHEEEGAMLSWWQRPAEAWTPEERLLAAGAEVVAELRAAVRRRLGYSCSAGIAHYKIMAKLASGLHKPGQQTLVPAAAVPQLLGPLPIPKLRQLGGKFGEQLMSALNITTVGQLAAVPQPKLEAVVGMESAAWLLRLARGQDEEDVKQRMLPKSCSCGKTFRGAKALRSLSEVEPWLLQLGRELEERLAADRQANQRLPQLLTVSIDAQPREQQQQRQQQVESAPSPQGQRQQEMLHGQHRVRLPRHQQEQEQQLAGLEDEEQEEGPAGHLHQQQQQHHEGSDDQDTEVLSEAQGHSDSFGPGAAAQPAGPAAASAAQGSSRGASGSAAGGGSSGSGRPRATPATWRAGVQTSSRSGPLGRPTAKSMAASALAMVKKWAADRPPGWCIVSLFLSASQFCSAPTGASTLERFMRPRQQQQQQQGQQGQQQQRESQEERAEGPWQSQPRAQHQQQQHPAEQLGGLKQANHNQQQQPLQEQQQQDEQGGTAATILGNAALAVGLQQSLPLQTPLDTEPRAALATAPEGQASLHQQQHPAAAAAAAKRAHWSDPRSSKRAKLQGGQTLVGGLWKSSSSRQQQQQQQQQGGAFDQRECQQQMHNQWQQHQEAEEEEEEQQQQQQQWWEGWLPQQDQAGDGATEPGAEQQQRRQEGLPKQLGSPQTLQPMEQQQQQQHPSGAPSGLQHSSPLDDTHQGAAAAPGAGASQGPASSHLLEVASLETRLHGQRDQPDMAASAAAAPGAAGAAGGGHGACQGAAKDSSSSSGLACHEPATVAARAADSSVTGEAAAAGLSAGVLGDCGRAGTSGRPLRVLSAAAAGGAAAGAAAGAQRNGFDAAPGGPAEVNPAEWVAWTAADIDPAVLSELPLQVQQEVWQAMRQAGQAAPAGSGAGRSAAGAAAGRRGGRGRRAGGRGQTGAAKRGPRAPVDSISKYFRPESSSKNGQ